MSGDERDAIWDQFDTPYVPYVRPAPPPCADNFGHDLLSTFGIVIARNGVRTIRSVCNECGWTGSHSWGYARFTEDERAAMQVVRDNRTAETARCEVCNAPDVELHHFAPRHIFGFEESDRWPTAWLCPECHRHWHRLVTPNMHRATAQ